MDFQDPLGESIKLVALDETGWVITTVPRGEVLYLARVACNIYGPVTISVQHQERLVRFEAPGNDTVAYFGHVMVTFESKPPNLFAAALTPPVVKAFLPDKPSTPSSARVFSDFEAATAELRQRYSDIDQRMKAVDISE